MSQLLSSFLPVLLTARRPLGWAGSPRGVIGRRLAAREDIVGRGLGRGLLKASVGRRIEMAEQRVGGLCGWIMDWNLGAFFAAGRGIYEGPLFLVLRGW